MNRSIALACSAVLVVCAAEAQDVDQAQIDALIRDLGADASETRDAAQAKLIELGKAAIPSLEKATKSQDLEVSSRAREALSKIQGQTPQPAQPDAPRPVPGVPEMPDMNRMLEELQKDFDQQMPDMGKMFEQLLEELQKGGPDPQQGNGRSRMRVWTFNGNNNGVFSGVSSRLGMGVGSPSAALRAQLGIDGRSGLVVNQVMPGGWAAQHGLQQYDVLVRRDGRPIKTLEDLTPLLAGGKLQLYRKATLQTLEIPAAAPEQQQEQGEGTRPRPAPIPKAKKGRNF